MCTFIYIIIFICIYKKRTYTKKRNFVRTKVTLIQKMYSFENNPNVLTVFVVVCSVMELKPKVWGVKSLKSRGRSVEVIGCDDFN